MKELFLFEIVFLIIAYCTVVFANKYLVISRLKGKIFSVRANKDGTVNISEFTACIGGNQIEIGRIEF